MSLEERHWCDKESESERERERARDGCERREQGSDNQRMKCNASILRDDCTRIDERIDELIDEWIDRLIDIDWV